MEDMLSSFAGFGVTGVVAYKLFLTFLEEKKEDKEAYKLELQELRTMYREELKEDRILYQNSMNMIVNKLETLEQDIIEIKENIDLKQ